MKRLIAILSLVMALMLVYGTTVTALAYSDKTDQGGTKELTGLVLNNVEGPVVGKQLDQMATVVSAEGVTWEIPVVWIDQSGKESTIAEAVKGYIPTFAFYVPEGYTVKTDENGVFSIKLPAFLETLLGYDNLVFVVDKEKKITYITFKPENVKVIRSYDPTTDYTDSSETVSATSTSDNSSTPDIPAPPTATEKEVEIHCTQNTIERIGTDNLKDLVYLIKNIIEPRAVAALTSAFPAFAEAAENGEIGKEIALYVYDSHVDTADADERNNESAVAYISGGYFAETTYCYILGVNTSTLYEIKNGKAVLIESQLKTLENTITHEVLHGIMDDYVRTGMASYDFDKNSVKNHFPMWFMEGSATAVENGFQYWKDYFNQSKENGSFTNASLAKAFRGKNDQHSFYRLDDGTEDPLFGSYGGGSLAIVYLSQLISQKDSAITGETVTAEMVRDGLNTILKELHNGTPLDTIIKDRTRYNGIEDFENKFLKANDPSATFCAEYLNRLDAVGGEGKRASGSILQDLDSTEDSVLAGRTDDRSTQKALVIKEENNYSKSESTVPDEVAKSTAGVRNSWQDSDNPHDPSEESEQAVAAKSVLKALQSTEKADSEGITNRLVVSGGITVKSEETQQEQDAAEEVADSEVKADIRSNTTDENLDATENDADIVTNSDIPTAVESAQDAEDLPLEEEPVSSVEPTQTVEDATDTEVLPMAEESGFVVEPASAVEAAPDAEIPAPAQDSVAAVDSALTKEIAPTTEDLDSSIESDTATQSACTQESAPNVVSEQTVESESSEESESSGESESASDSENDSEEASEDVSDVDSIGG